MILETDNHLDRPMVSALECEARYFKHSEAYDYEAYDSEEEMFLGTTGVMIYVACPNEKVNRNKYRFSLLLLRTGLFRV